MFTHHGNRRTPDHNLQIASLLSFVAGIVNVAGFLAIQKLTTNVTGHFAFFVDEVFKLNFWDAFIYFLYIFFFFLGSFSSSLLVEYIARKNSNYTYSIPTAIEAFVLLVIAIFGKQLITENPNVIAFVLLYAMGLQNSLVTRISNSVVRTTHLTGLFTDLGIELSQLFFYHEISARTKLFISIKLRLTIISFFFLGGIIVGVFYMSMGLYVVLFAVLTLFGGLIYDSAKLRLLQLKRKLRH